MKNAMKKMTAAIVAIISLGASGLARQPAMTEGNQPSAAGAPSFALSSFALRR